MPPTPRSKIPQWTPPDDHPYIEPDPLPEPGTPYEGPVAYCDDYYLVPRPGFYATDENHQIIPSLRLTYIDDAPHDADDGTGHFEVSAHNDPVQRKADPTASVPPENIVALNADAQGTSGVSS